MSKFVLVDASGLFAKQYMGYKNVDVHPVTFNGKTVKLQAISGYFNRIAHLKEYLRTIEDVEFIHVFDPKEKETLKNDIYLEYKKNRKEKEEEYLFLRELLVLYCLAKNEKVLRESRVEADDLIGSMAKKLEKEGHEVVVFSNDKDFFQLLTPSISILRTEKGEDGYNLYSSYQYSYIERQYGFLPSSFADFLAIQGDSVDNIKGVKGIGEKGAKELIQIFQNIEFLLDNLDELPLKYKGKFTKEQVGLLPLWKKLTSIITNLDVPAFSNLTNSLNNLVLSETLLKLLKESEMKNNHLTQGMQ